MNARRRRPRASRPPADERGFALLLVMLFTAIALVVVADLQYQANCELLAARNIADIGQIEYAIDGQFEVTLGQLRFDKRQNDVDSEFDEWNGERFRSRKDGDVGLTTKVFDEQAKFNLSRLVVGSDPQKLRAKEILVRILDLFREDVSTDDKTKGGDLSLSDAEDIADRIIRYMKREGARGEVPKPKISDPNLRDVPQLLDELMFVDTKESRLFATLLQDVQTKEKVAPGLHRYLTVFGTTSPKVNLNTVSLVVMKAEFSQAADRDFAQKIIDRRRTAAENSPSGTGTPAMSTSPPAMSPATGTTGATTGGNPFTDVRQLTDGSIDGLTDEILQRNGIDAAVEFDVKSDFFGVRIQGATERTQRDELYVIERAKDANAPSGWGFRFLLHQERTDPLLYTEDDYSASPAQ